MDNFQLFWNILRALISLVRTAALTRIPTFYSAIHTTSIPIDIITIITLKSKPLTIATDLLTQLRHWVIKIPNSTLKTLVTVYATKTALRAWEALFKLGLPKGGGGA